MQARLSRTLLYTYGIADMFFALMMQMELYYFVAFLMNYSQFSPHTYNVILLVTGIVDVASALIAGIILQKTNLKLGGKYRSWFLIGPPLIMPLFILQFTKIGSETLAAGIIIIGFVGSHLLWNVVVASGGAMIGKLSQNPDERTVLSASRAQGISASNLIFSITGPPLILYLNSHAGSSAGFPIAVAIYAALMIIGYLYVYKITSGKDTYDQETAKRESDQSIGETITLVFKNPPLLMLMIAEIFRYTYFMLISAMAVYYFAYVVKNEKFMAVFLLVSSIGSLAGTFNAPWIGLKIGKRKCYWGCLLAAAAGFASAKLFSGTSWTFTLIIAVAQMFAYMAASMSTALFTDAAIYGEWKTGKSIRAFTMALINLPIKLGVLLRSAIVSLGLAAIGFVATEAPTPQVMDGISSMMTFANAAMCIVSAVIFYFGYRIEDSRILSMQEEIAKASH
jgi:Na+/melibiose symporter-like transporter